MCKQKKLSASIMRCLSLSLLLTTAWGVSLPQSFAQPVNDNFDEARELVSDTGTITGSNVGATHEGGEAGHGGTAFFDASVWFVWTATLDGDVTFDTIGSDFDTLLDVYDGTDIFSINELGAPIRSSDDLNSAAFGSRNLNGASGVTVSVTNGMDYFIAVDGFNGDMGSFTLNWKRGGARASGEFEFTSTNYFATFKESVLDHSDANGNQSVNRDVPGVLITVTRKNGSSGKVIVPYFTEDIVSDPDDPDPIPAAVEDIDYEFTEGELVFEDHQMSASFIVPINRLFIPPGTDVGVFFKAFNVVISDPFLAMDDASGLDESSDLALPRVSAEHGVATVGIAQENPFPQGPNELDPTLPDNRAGSVQFERGHYRRTEGNYTAQIRVNRTGGTADQQRGAVTVQYRINRASNGDPRSSWNVFPLSAGSDYARPDTEFNGDYTVEEPSLRTLTIPATPAFAYIEIPITQDDRAEFNEDIHIELVSDSDSPSPRIVQPTDAVSASGYEVGYQNVAILTIMYDDYPAGAVDSTHNADHDANTNPSHNAAPGVNGSVYSVAVQPDGKTVLGGSFTTYNGVDQNRVTRMNSDGSLDTGFNPGSGANDFITSVQLVPDGKIIVGGAFSSFNSDPLNSLARLNADGSVDASFNLANGINGTVWAVALQSDGKILVGGDFSSIENVARKNVARLNADGSVDLTFDPGVGPDGTVFSLAADTNGSVLIGGEFTSVNGLSRNSIARLDGSGIVSTNFAPLTGADGIIYSIALQPDGKILIGGAFSEFDSTSRNSIARLNSDGSLDTSFECGTGASDTVYSVALQPNGKILMGGLFTSVNGTRRMGVARLFSHGPVDTSFLDTAYNQFAGLVSSFDNLDINPRNYVFALGIETNGNVIIGGGFSKVGGGRGSREVRTEQYSLNDFDDPINFLDENTRATYRIRHNVARLLGGETPGPGNIEFASNTYSVDQGASRFFVPLVRTNYTADTNYLGAITANFATRTLSAGPGAVSEDDFFMDSKYGNPRWGSSWNRTNKLAFTRMQSDGFFGNNGATQPFNDTYNHGEVISLEGEAFVYLDIFANSSLEGDKKLKLELTQPKGARTRDESAFALFSSQFFQVFQVLDPGFSSSFESYFYFDLEEPAFTDQNLEWSLGGEFIPLGTALGRSSAELTISDRRPKNGVLNFSAPEFVVNETGTNARVVVTRTEGSQGAVSVQYATTDGTAIKTLDYTPTSSGRLDFADGAPNGTILIPIINDTISINSDGTPELDETFTVRLFSPTLGAKLGTLTNTTVKIIDDDYLPGRLSFTNLNLSANEGSPVAVIAVTRTGGSQQSVSVQYSSYLGGSAIQDEDYTGVTNTLTWNAGDTSTKTFTIPILNDGQVENDKTVLIRLTNGKVNGNASSAVIGSIPNASLTIRDDDFYGTFGFSSVSYYENENAGTTAITIVRTSGISGSVTLNLEINNNGTLTSTPVSFAPGERTKTISIPIANDFDPAPNRIINLSLTGPSPTGALLGLDTATLTIFDDENFNEPPGSVDTTFNPSHGLNDFVYSLAIQPDGKILVGGDFTAANAVSRNRLARLNINGTLDARFSSAAPSLGANGSVRSVVIQTDNRILVGGLFTTVNNVGRNRIDRLNNDGTSDSTFNPGSGANNPIYALAETFVGDSAEPENRRILAVGAFTTFNNASRGGIVRLKNDGTLDEVFNPGNGANGTNAVIRCLAVQLDGKVIVGGDFLSFNNDSARYYLARLNLDGSVDSTFNPGIGPNGSVHAMTIQPDGKILIGGIFTNVGGASFNHIARLEANGAIDATFLPGVGANDSVFAIVLQTDGRIVLGGEFTQANGVSRNRLTRLNSDGTVDPSINFGSGANNFVSALGIDRFGRIVLGGGFTEFDGVTRRHIARIYGRSSGVDSGRIEFSSADFEVTESGTNAVITVLRKGGTTGNVSVDLNTADETAINGVDYLGVSTNLVFPNGETTRTINIPVINNDFVEVNKTVHLTLSNSTAQQLGNQQTATLIIQNDDAAISFSAPTYNEAENVPGGNAVISIIRTGSSIGTASVDFITTTNGTASPTLDFTPSTNIIFFADGETNKLTVVPLVNDLIIEGDETVSMELGNVIGAILSEPVGSTLTIMDDESGPGNLAFTETNYVIGEAGSFAVITVVRTNGSQGFVSVDFSTAAGGTASPGIDYSPTNGTLAFGPGEISKFFSVQIVADSISEGNESLAVVLSNPTGGATITGTNPVPLTIVDDDVAFSFSTRAYVVGEGDSGVTIAVHRDHGSNGIVRVSYKTANGNATNGLDYHGKTNTLIFSDGELIKTFTIPILEDALVEGDEIFSVSLFDATAGTHLVNPSNAVVTIVDNDSSLSFLTSEFTVDESGTNAIITVARTNTSSGTVSINFATSNGTALAGVDYSATNGTLTLLDGQASATITIPIAEDTFVEGDETFTVTLSNPSSGALLGTPSSATVTIVDNDAGLRFSSSSYAVSESGVSANITVLRTTVTNTTVSVNYSVANGTATDGSDYIGQINTLTFTNGETTKTFTVSIIDDTTIEGDETVLLTLFAPSGAATIVNPGAAVLTLTDNDGSLIVPAGSALISESLNGNGVIDASETVSLFFAFRNTVGVNTTDLHATLLSGNGISSPSGEQSYGVLAVNGASVSRQFSFTASGTNGQQIMATFQLNDGAFDLGTATFTYTLGSSTVGFTNSAAIMINDSSSPPTLASPYPSSINVSGVLGTVNKITVTLSNLSHSFPDDIDILLVSPSGQKVILMSDAGGGDLNTITNRTITFSDSAPGFLPDSSLISSGTFRPSDYASTPTDRYPVPAPAGPYASTLSVFNGANPNGTWSLFVVDDTFFNSGSIAKGWSLAISTASSIPATADLSIGMTDSPDPSATNNILTYTISITNHGPSAAVGIVVTNLLPVGVTYVSDTCDCAVTANTLICPVPNLAKDAVASFDVLVNPTAVGQFTNTATVRGNQNDPNLLNNTASAVTTVDIPRADLSISLSDSPDPVQINEDLTYTIVLRNLGPSAVAGIIVTNPLPPGAVLVSVTLAHGTYTNSNGTLIIYPGDLFAPTLLRHTSPTETITVVVRPTIAGIITNVVTVSSAINDPFKANNTASVKTLVELPPLSLSASLNGLSIEWGTNAPGYIIESTTSLAQPTTWLPVTNPPVAIQNGKNRMIVDLSDGTRFFRLNPQAP